MTQSEALTEARRRWGKDAHAQTTITKGKTYYQIGVPMVLYIEADSWEAAFADADKREVTNV